MRKNLLIACSLFVVVACERTSFSPVEIKLDESISGLATTPIVKNTYRIKEDETLFDVANRFNVDPMNLAQINGIKPPYNVRKGQVLILPADEEKNTQQELLAPYAPVQMEQKNNNELDEKFDKLIGSQRSADSTTKTTQVSEKSAADERALSSPKITQTTTGTDISHQSEKQSVAEQKAVAAGKMPRPTEGKVISKFGDMQDGLPNDGINIKAAAGTPVKAVAEGEVLYAGDKLDDSFGNVVVLRHNDGLISSYANLKDISVKQGARLKAGQKLGTVGQTGDVKEPQLHFEIMKDNTPLNPDKYLAR